MWHRNVDVDDDDDDGSEACCGRALFLLLLFLCLFCCCCSFLSASVEVYPGPLCYSVEINERWLFLEHTETKPTALVHSSVHTGYGSVLFRSVHDDSNGLVYIIIYLHRERERERERELSLIHI